MQVIIHPQPARPPLQAPRLGLLCDTGTMEEPQFLQHWKRCSPETAALSQTCRGARRLAPPASPACLLNSHVSEAAPHTLAQAEVTFKPEWGHETLSLQWMLDFEGAS